MNFWDTLFGWRISANEPSESCKYTHIFSVWHFVALTLIIGAIVAICLVARKKDKKWQDRLFIVLALILLGLEILRITYRTITYCCYEKYDVGFRNIYDWSEIISFALCTMITYFTIVTLLVNKKKWNSFAYDAIFCIALLGGAIALIYPDMLNTYYPIYHILSIQTLITHGILILIPILLLVTKRLTLNIKNIWKPFVVMLCFVVIARTMSVITGNNFMFMNGFDIIPVFDGMPFWEYIWFFLLMFIAYLGICYLPSIIIGAVRSAKAKKQHTAETKAPAEIESQKQQPDMNENK